MKIILILLLVVSTSSSLILLKIKGEISNKDHSLLYENNPIFLETSFGLVETNSDFPIVIKIHLKDKIYVEENSEYVSYIEKGGYLNPIRKIKGIESVEVVGFYEIVINKGLAFSSKDMLNIIIPMLSRILENNIATNL